MELEPRSISEDDWEAFRALRLRALADAPDAFGATLADAEVCPEEEWRLRAGGNGPVVMAFAPDGSPVAMGGLYRPPGSEQSFIWGMWVDPAWRGRGVGSRVLASLLEHTVPADRVSLHVADGNEGARRMYEAHGFASTEEWEPLRAGSPVRIERLERPVVPAP